MSDGTTYRERVTSPVSIDQAAAFLRHRYDGRAEDFEVLGGGDWSRAFGFWVDGRALVARFGQHRDDYLRDSEAMAFSSPDLPVPRVLEIGDGLGGVYAISERHFGDFLETLDEAAWRRVLPAVLRALDVLRDLPAPRGVGWRDQLLDGLVDHPGGRVSGWRATLARSEELDSLYRRGEQAVASLLGACPEDPHVLHQDLLNRNVLVAKDSSRLEAVFDWGCQTEGDFLYEVAWFTFWAPWHPGLAAIDLRREVLRHYEKIDLAVPDFEERLRCYEVHIGLIHLAYCAFVRRRDELDQVAARTREILES